MNKVTRIILATGFILAFMAILFFLSRMQKETLRASLPVSGRLIDLSTEKVAVLPDSPGSERSSRAKVSPEWGELILDALDLNLDEDEELEQAIVYKDSNSGRRNLSILIADYQPLTGSYVRTWKSETRATKTNAFIVQPRDLIHDGSIELLCFGLDEENQQTLDVFRRIPRRSAYARIFSAAGVDIAIEDVTDSASITVFETLENGASALDRRKTSFEWDARKGNYVATNQVIVPGADVEQIFLGNTLSGNTSEFEAYLSGLWVQSDGLGAEETALYFDTSARKIIISDSRNQEEWHWSESNASASGLYASIVNASLPELLQLLNIELIGIDKIKVRATSQQSIRFSTRENWNGVFQRFSELKQKSAIPSIQPVPRGQGMIVPLQASNGSVYLTEKALYGTYALQDGISIEFSASGFVKSDGKAVVLERGSFCFFKSGSSVILEMVSLTEDGRSEKKNDYFLELRHENTKQQLVLKPALMAEGTVSLSYKPDLILELVLAQGSK